MGIDLHIEELVLHGFPSRDRHRIADAMRLELTRLLTVDAGHGQAARSLTRVRIDGGSFAVKAGATPQAAGREVARAVFRGLRQPAGVLAGASASSSGQRGRRP
jgi:hypothetical protein